MIKTGLVVRLAKALIAAPQSIRAALVTANPKGRLSCLSLPGFRRARTSLGDPPVDVVAAPSQKGTQTDGLGHGFAFSEPPNVSWGALQLERYVIGGQQLLVWHRGFSFQFGGGLPRLKGIVHPDMEGLFFRRINREIGFAMPRKGYESRGLTMRVCPAGIIAAHDRNFSFRLFPAPGRFPPLAFVIYGPFDFFVVCVELIGQLIIVSIIAATPCVVDPLLPLALFF